MAAGFFMLGFVVVGERSEPTSKRVWPYLVQT